MNDEEEQNDLDNVSPISIRYECNFNMTSYLILLLADAGDFEHTVFVHVFDQCAQDSDLVVAIICDILTTLKTNDLSIEQACIRSDNAGCYHSANTILSMPLISNKTGVVIRRMDFADPQGGRGNLFFTSHCKSNLNFLIVRLE